MMPFFDPRFPGDGKAEHFQLILRRRPDGKQPEINPDAREELSQIISYLETLRANVRAPKSSGEAPPRLTLPEQRKAVAKKLKMARVRLGSRIAQGLPLSKEDLLEDLALLTDSKLMADATAPRDPAETAPAPATASPAAVPGRGAGWLLTLMGIVCLAAGGSATYFWTRPAVSRDEPPMTGATPAPEANVSPEAMRTAERVLQMIQFGKLDAASGQLAAARKQGLALPGLRYQAALLALRQGEVQASMDWISQSLAAREFVPECLYLRANSAATGGDYAAVCENFEEATHHAAFSPRYFFFWGEALRRYGHSTQALAQFERALLCRPNTADADLIRFKMGLAQIEAGADEKFETGLRSALEQKVVSGDALLLAAAVEINRAAYPAAAGYLQRAKGALPPALLAARLRDFLFQSRARQEDLAAAWPVTTPAGPIDVTPAHGRVVIDPATRSLAEADPAVW